MVPGRVTCWVEQVKAVVMLHSSRTVALVNTKIPFSLSVPPDMLDEFRKGTTVLLTIPMRSTGAVLLRHSSTYRYSCVYRLL